MKIKKEELYEKLKEKIEETTKYNDFQKIIYFLMNQLENPSINRTLIFKDLPEFSNEMDIFRFIHDKTGIPFLGAIKNFKHVATVLFKSVRHCKEVWEKLSKSDNYIKGRKIKIELYKASKFDLLLTHFKRLLYIEKLRKDINFQKGGYDDLWYENEDLKRKLEQKSNKLFDLESQIAQLNEKLQNLMYARESINVHLQDEGKKKFEELKKKCIKKIQDFKI